MMSTANRFKIRILTLFLLSFCLIIQGFAANEAMPANPKTPAPSELSVGEDPGPVYTQLIHDWATVTHFAKNAADVSVDKLTFELKADPRYANLVTPNFIADLTQFFYELYLSPETMSLMARLYAQFFTLDEMAELIKFYKTPLGQKLVKSDNDLTIKTEQISYILLKKHELQYRKVLQKYLKPIQEQNKSNKKAI
ncbi:MAG: DUF2059 domain-containing protein [Candidatus Berkiellales bacterium]